MDLAEATFENGAIVFRSPYDRRLVNSLKEQIAASRRKWDNERKVWIIDPAAFDTLADITRSTIGVALQRPAMPVSASQQATVRLFRVDYLGACKDRGGNESAAFGSVDGRWLLMMPETVLRDWFQAGPAIPGAKATLYADLGIPKDADLAAVKSAYRRLARQWHPDSCREPGASEQFMLIQKAYEVLSDDRRRRKYDAGLALEASLVDARAPQQVAPVSGYRSPLRCGYILTAGSEVVGRFNVDRILKWEDIKDDQGRIMVSSWSRGADNFIVQWV